jgi:hypothetical protein
MPREPSPRLLRSQPMMRSTLARCLRPPRTALLAGFLALFALAFTAAAFAAPAAERATYRLALGAAKPHEERWATTIAFGLERDWRPFHGGRLSWDGMLMAFDRRDGEGGRAELDRAVLMAAGGLRWRRGGFINGFAVGLATPRTAAISGPLQFVTTLGYGWTHWAVLVQHVSNAGFEGRNHGETMLMLEWSPGAR